MGHMAVLLFGFEGFLEYKDNPAKVVVEALNHHRVGGHEVLSVVLPVEYGKAPQIVSREISSVKPVLALGVGLAPGRAKLTPEKIAINYKYSKEPDNAGVTARGDRLDDGPDGMFTNIPVEEIVDHLNSMGIPAELSLSAGSYLCNAVMYTIIREQRKHGGLGGFVHVPCHEKCASSIPRPIPSMSLDTMVRGVRTVVEYSLTKLSPTLMERSGR